MNFCGLNFEPANRERPAIGTQSDCQALVGPNRRRFEDLPLLARTQIHSQDFVRPSVRLPQQWEPVCVSPRTFATHHVKCLVIRREEPWTIWDCGQLLKLAVLQVHTEPA